MVSALYFKPAEEARQAAITNLAWRMALLLAYCPKGCSHESRSPTAVKADEHGHESHLIAML